MMSIVEKVKRALLDNPEGPNTAGLKVIDQHIVGERQAKIDERQKMVDLVQRKRDDGA
jgi:hypothetical protein